MAAWLAVGLGAILAVSAALGRAELGSAVALGFVLTAVPSLPTTVASGVGHHGDSRCRRARRCGTGRPVRRTSAGPRRRHDRRGGVRRPAGPGRADGGPRGRADRRRRPRWTAIAGDHGPVPRWGAGCRRGVVGVVRVRTRYRCRTPRNAAGRGRIAPTPMARVRRARGAGRGRRRRGGWPCGVAARRSGRWALADHQRAAHRSARGGGHRNAARATPFGQHRRSCDRGGPAGHASVGARRRGR